MPAASDRSYSSVWARPRRKGRSTLTLEQIVTEAVRLLDAEGIEALSMRKLAAGLGAGATSLYWHVANRDELIELVLDEIYGELDVPDPDADDVDDWQATARSIAHDIRSTTHRHPWVVSVLEHLAGAYLGPNLTRATERMIGVFEKAGFEVREAERALGTLTSYVSGVVMGEAAWRNWLARRGQTEQEWLEESQKMAAQATEEYPRLREVVADFEGKDPKQAMDEDFEYGLQRVLDGLQSRLDALRQTKRTDTNTDTPP